MTGRNHNLTAWSFKVNDIRIRRYEQFLKKNKLNSTLMVSESGEVIDLYSDAIMKMDIGFRQSIWMQLCRMLSKGFYKIGSGFLEVCNLPSVWTRYCYKLSGVFHYIGSLLFRAGNIGS